MPSQASAPKPASTPPSAADFDQAFSASVSPGIRRVWERAEPGLPAEVEPFSFVSAGLLRHVLRAADLGPGQTLAELETSLRDAGLVKVSASRTGALAYFSACRRGSSRGRRDR